MGRAGRHMVEQYFSHDVKAAKIERLYRQILWRKGYLSQ
jgi:hypothetical protein